MRRNNKSLGCDYYIKGKKRPFATCTTATRDLIELLYEEYKDWNLVLENINYDEDARNVVIKIIGK